MKHSVREPAEKASAAVASCAVMELLAHQRSTGVAEAAPAPAAHEGASLRPLHVHPAVGAPLPPLGAGEPPQHHVLPAALVLPELLELLAADAVVPRHHAPGAEQPAAVRAIGLRDAPLAGHTLAGEERRRAVPERAVDLLLPEHGRRLAQREVPLPEQVRGDEAAAVLQLDRAVPAAGVGAPHMDDVLADLGSDVLHGAAQAEGVAARGDDELESAGHALHADGAVEFVPVAAGCRRRRFTSLR